jgi:hypothetical protein
METAASKPIVTITITTPTTSTSTLFILYCSLTLEHLLEWRQSALSAALAATFDALCLLPNKYLGR